MKIVLAIAYLIALVLYIGSHYWEIPVGLERFVFLLEKLILYFYLFILAILSMGQISKKFLQKEKKSGAYDINAGLMKAHVFATRIIVFLVIICVPLIIYLNKSQGWNLSDTVMVAIPTVMLAVLVAEQNVYTFTSSRLDDVAKENAMLASIRQVISDIKLRINDTPPDQYTQQQLISALERLQSHTKDSNFSKWASQALLTINTISTKSDLDLWKGLISMLDENLSEDIL